MSCSDEQRIGDVFDAANELAGVVQDGHQRFLDEVINQRAAERLLEIMGEAASSLSEETTERYPEIAWRDMARLRILLAHHYHRVDPEQVWVIATVDVPLLSIGYASINSRVGPTAAPSWPHVTDYGPEQCSAAACSVRTL